MEQSNPPLRASNIADIKAKVAEMVGQGGGSAPVTPGGYAYTLYEGDSSVNSITLSDSAFHYDKLVVEGYYMAMGAAAMDIAITAEWPKNKDKRKFQITTNDLTTGSTPALTVTTDVWEVSEDGMDLDLVLALQGVDTDSVEVTPETTSQITITKVVGFNNISTGPAHVGGYDVPYFDGGEYGAIAYIDADGEVAYYTATSASDLVITAPSQNFPVGTIKTMENGYKVDAYNLLAYSFGSAQTTVANYTLCQCGVLRAVYGTEKITTFGNYFCYGGHALVSPITLNPAGATIGSYFLASCTAFNQPITVTGNFSLGANFLNGCTNFNSPLTITGTPTGTSLASGFLENCTAFNQPLALPVGYTLINGSFLSGCINFNQPLRLPETITTLVNGNSSTSGFLTGCRAFAQPLALPDSVTALPNYFMWGCTAFAGPLTLPSVLTSIGTYILSGCYAFTGSLQIPPTVTSIGSAFMQNCHNFTGPLEIDTLAAPSSSTASLSSTIIDSNMYTTGVTLTGPGAQTWKDALPDRTTSPYRKLIVAEEAETA